MVDTTAVFLPAAAKRRPFNSSNTGNTDFRDTEVHQPKTAATFSLDNKSRAFSAKSGQFEAGSTTTASTFLPSNPPFLFMSSTIIRMVSLRVVSLIAIVPDSEWRTPILIVPWVWAVAAPDATAITATATTTCHILFGTLVSPSFHAYCGPVGRHRLASKIKAKPRKASARFDLRRRNQNLPKS